MSTGNCAYVRVYVDVTFPLTSMFALHQQPVFACSPHRPPRVDSGVQAEAAGLHA